MFENNMESQRPFQLQFWTNFYEGALQDFGQAEADIITRQCPKALVKNLFVINS